MVPIPEEDTAWGRRGSGRKGRPVGRWCHLLAGRGKGPECVEAEHGSKPVLGPPLPSWWDAYISGEKPGCTNSTWRGILSQRWGQGQGLTHLSHGIHHGQVAQAHRSEQVEDLGDVGVG